MIPHLLKTLVSAVVVAATVSVLVFLLLRAVPGDPIVTFFGEETGDPETVEALRRQYGLDDPLVTQYGRYLTGALTGDFGTSLQTGRPIGPDLVERAGATARLAFTAVGFALAIGIPLGLFAGVKRYSWWDNLTMTVSLVGISVPVYWLGLLAIVVFSINFGWFPTMGDATPRHLVLPALTLAAPSVAIISRVTRASTLDVIEEEYIRTARAKGASGRRVIARHLLRNAMMPVVTVAGIQFGYMLAGTVFTESIFSWPGLGRYIVNAVQARDYPVVQAGLLFIAVGFVVLNSCVDLLYTALNPRLRARVAR